MGHFAGVRGWSWMGGLGRRVIHPVSVLKLSREGGSRTMLSLRTEARDPQGAGRAVGRACVWPARWPDVVTGGSLGHHVSQGGSGPVGSVLCLLLGRPGPSCSWWPEFREPLLPRPSLGPSLRPFAGLAAEAPSSLSNQHSGKHCGPEKTRINTR